MGDHTMSIADAARIIGAPRSTVRRWFDAAGGAAGGRHLDTGERRPTRQWVIAAALRRERRQRAARAPGLSVAQAAAQLNVSPTTVRRWFDRDRPASGNLEPAGRTGTTERRCDPAWVAAVASDLGRS